MFDDVVVVYRFVGDLQFYVTGDQGENEVVLASVLHAFAESITLLLRWGRRAGERVYWALCGGRSEMGWGSDVGWRLGGRGPAPIGRTANCAPPLLLLAAGMPLRRRLCLRTWTSCCWPWTKSWMEGGWAGDGGELVDCVQVVLWRW